MAELTLGEIFPNKLSSYTTKLKDINTLYLLFYGQQDFIIDIFTIEELVKLCAWFQFETTGSAEKLTERLCTRLATLKQLTPENEDESDDENIGINDDANDDDGLIEKETTTIRRPATVPEARQQGEPRRYEQAMQQQPISRRGSIEHDERRRVDNDPRRKMEYQRRTEFSPHLKDNAQHYDNEIQRLTDEIKRLNEEFRHRDHDARRIERNEPYNEEGQQVDYLRRTHYQQEHDDDPRIYRNEINTRTTVCAIRPRDVEALIPAFTADDDYPIEKWLSDFEDIARMANLNELEKAIFGRKAIKGTAAKFLRSTYSMLVRA
ncbi:hypothetical protein ALC62_13654 [Cyphomyrmex costatus]|uniref:Uncharacterized protein n=1 Tax=Cyphomyrmex costatus TaxID=456900 RepID=A0A151I9F3_9HYME|nr:hypothetical protein ALC62_13654 [Cyphomyrmex costatus]